jgi:ATP-dependent helicase/nuclease subunit A
MNPQNTASNPKASSFLTANAGSGKTSTLVARVARLLLNGAKPEYIVCLTYTKAAAAEMQARLYETLGGWAVASDENLALALLTIDEAVRDLGQARALFAQALETPGGLKIQTLHGFCEKLLRRFPLEAGLSPAFQVMDEAMSRSVSKTAISALLTDPETKAFDPLIRKLKRQRFEKLLTQFQTQHDKIAKGLTQLQLSENWLKKLYESLGLDEVISRRVVIDRFAQSLDWAQIKALGQAMLGYKDKTSPKIGQQLLDCHEAFLQSGDFDCLAYGEIFFTQKGDLRKHYYSKAFTEAVRQQLISLSQATLHLIDKVKACEVAYDTWQALLLFERFSALYLSAKRAQGGLDFTDLISKCRDLLEDETRSAFVLYKLDGGFNHILVDEAQDTSADQWMIVRALSAAFFTPPDETYAVRTVFAVGDEKQSIYGFQGAEPKMFLDERRYFLAKALGIGQSLSMPQLTMSYRSLPEILGFVDAAFADEHVAHALNFDTQSIIHEAVRVEPPGLVELWPQLMPLAKPKENDPLAAPDAPSPDSPQKRLAQALATHIASEIHLGRSVYDKGLKIWRPLRAGDVLILVRKRLGFSDHLIRALKLAEVPVSGADRLKLSSHIAFQDLRAVLRFCAQPLDNLALAEVLRSPLCDVSEEDLYVLSQRGSLSLWQSLQMYDGFGDTKRFLDWALTEAKNLTAFDLLSRILSRKDANGLTQRQRFLTRLGLECEDVLDETLNLALSFESKGAASVKAFLHLSDDELGDIKREQDDAGDRVTVMTIHGAKGLEAPWVICVIAPVHASAKNEDVLMTDQALIVNPGAIETPQIVAKLKADKALQTEAEDVRLFYVALTRARDRLTVCGFQGKRAAKAGHYPDAYALAQSAFLRLEAGAIRLEPLSTAVDFGLEVPPMVSLYGQRSRLMSLEASQHQAVALPEFVLRPMELQDDRNMRWRAISNLGNEDRAQSEVSPSPLARNQGLGRYRRGELIHKLFEILPELAADKRAPMGALWLRNQAELQADQADEILHSVMTVLEDARFAEAFGPSSRPEVAVAGQLIPGLSLSGRIDRLVVGDERVLIIDYKSNRPAPDRAEDAPIDYQRQMAGYVGLLRHIYPHMRIEAALLWTDGPKLTPLSDTLIDDLLLQISR